MTRQEMFDKAAAHLLEQGQCALDDTGHFNCRYRTAGGLKCAVGALIPDELYHPKFEGRSASWMSRNLACFSLKDEEFLSDLQRVHDQERYKGVPDFLPGLRKLAAHYGLECKL